MLQSFFVISNAGRVLQAVETPGVNPCQFDGGISGGRIYAYVGNDPLNRSDPLGLCDNPQGCGGGSSNSSGALTQATKHLQADLQLGSGNETGLITSPPVPGLENGYWRQKTDGRWLDPSTGKVGGTAGQTHIPLPLPSNP